MTERPTDPVAAARLARDALEAAAASQAGQADPDHGQFYNYGREIVGVLTALDDLTATLRSQLAHYGDQRVLRDNAGADPQRRLTEASGHLAELRAALWAAAGHAERFWTAIGHVGVETDPDADADEPD